MSRPVHRHKRFLALVAVGGALGTALRELLSLLVPAIDGVAVVIVGINLLGALALGVLLEALVRSGPDEGRRRAIRLFVGTGVLGGFTTYSTLAVTTAGLLGEGRAAVGLGYALGSVILGALATTLGIVIGGAWHRRARVAAPSNQPARSTGERG